MVTPVHKPTFIAQLCRALDDFRKHANADTGPELDVRLYVDPADQNWWVSTGLVDYDTTTADLCAMGSLDVTYTRDDVIAMAQSMLDDIDYQAEEERS